MADDPRLDALASEMHAMRLAINEVRDTILERIDTAYVRKDNHALEVQALNDRVQVLAREVAELKAGRNWVVAIVLSAVIIAVLGLVLTHG